MSDLAFEFRVKNGRLKRAIFATGVKSYAEFCRRTLISAQELSGLLTMKRPAWSRKKNDWMRGAYDLSSALKCEPEDLWPEELRDVELSKNSGEFSLTVEQARTMTAPAMRAEAVAALTSRLNLRELKAVTAVARGRKLAEVGEGIGQDGGTVSKTRAEQIYLKGVRKMKREAIKRGLVWSDFVTEVE